VGGPEANDLQGCIFLSPEADRTTIGAQGETTMHAPRLNRLSGIALLLLSLVALFAVLSGYGHPLPPDEGAAAHLFQLSVVALLAVGLLFLGTADWTRPGRGARPLVLPAMFLAIAFAALYHLEHRG
jgi:hypothetical protein